MADRLKTAMLVLLVLGAAVTGLVSFAVPASGRVSIVPDAAIGGGVHTFAFRLANERSDTATTGLELVFPDNPPVTFVEVAPVRGWHATIESRSLNPPMRAGDQRVTEVASSIVLRGGSVAPREFEQFVITLGPLPERGRLVFEGTQRYANGAVEALSGDVSPAITLGDTPRRAMDPAATAAERSAAGTPGAGSQGPDHAGHVTTSGNEGPFLLVVVGGVLVLTIGISAIVGVRSRLRRRAETTEAEQTATDESVEVAR